MPPYSKSQVDRAGVALLGIIDDLRRDADLLNDNSFLARAIAPIETIEWWRAEHAKPLSRVAANLRHYVADEGPPVVAQRLKRTPTITAKLLREQPMRLSQMADIGGVRAILPNQEAVYRVANRLRRNWTITRTRDYAAKPKEDGYRAVHLIGRNRGKLIELQLRTPLQDAWANAIEERSRNSSLGLKSGEGPLPLRELLADASAILARLETGEVSGVEAKRMLTERAAQLFCSWKQMTPDEIQHFLISFDPATGEADVRRFGTDYDAAQVAYAEAERANGLGGTLDIVLLSADSLATIEKTHSSYFSGGDSLLKELLKL